MKEFTPLRVAEALPDRASQAVNGTITRLDRMHAFAGVLGLGLIAFLAIEPTYNWLLLLLSGLTALAADNIVRMHPQARFQRLDDTALFLFVPVLFTLGAGLFLKQVVGGTAGAGLGILTIPAYWLILWAEYQSVDRRSGHFILGRGILNAATYIIAFLFFATIYDFDLSLVTASFAAGIVSLLLGIEVVREEAMDTTRTIAYALAIGLLLAEAAWVTHFLPLEGSSAAVFLLLAFYLMTGLMHNYLGDRLSLRTGSEFATVAGAGLALVILSRSYL
ncbi:MAG: hypothetical protein E6J42_05810 [Chloroflexi bacterium]|nr:MAG: hypothetical protein E6J42_05810 [Chloroflexota bacterium]